MKLEKYLPKLVRGVITFNKSMGDNGNIKGGYSEISQVLFRDILNSYSDINDTKYVFFWTKNNEYYLKSNNSIYLYDFTDIKNNKMIEYNGDQYHANPSIYSHDSYPHPYHKKEGYRAKDIWLKDKNKIEFANNNGFEVLTIWDSEYRKNPQQTLQKCIEFINE